MGVQRRYKWDQKGTWIYKSTKGIQGMGLDGICKKGTGMVNMEIQGEYQ